MVLFIELFFFTLFFYRFLIFIIIYLFLLLLLFANQVISSLINYQWYLRTQSTVWYDLLL